MILGIESALHARIVETFDAVEHISPSVRQGGITAVMHSLTLEQAEEDLHGRVAPAVTDRTPATGELMAFEEQLVVCAGELRAAVRVQDDRTAMWTLPAGHHHRPEYHVPVLHRGHRPARDLVQNRSSTAHRYSQPSPARMKVVSTTHLVFGPSAWKPRSRWLRTCVGRAPLGLS